MIESKTEERERKRERSTSGNGKSHSFFSWSCVPVQPAEALLHLGMCVRYKNRKQEASADILMRTENKGAEFTEARAANENRGYKG